MPGMRRRNQTRKNRSARLARAGVRSTVRKAVISAKRKTFNARVKRVLNRVSETKYVANQYANGAALNLGQPNNLAMPYNVNANLGTVGQYLPAIPAVTLGDDDWQRDGSVIQPVGLRSKLNFYFQQPVDASGQIISTNPGQFIVKVFYGVGRKQKLWDAGETPIVSAGDLLEKGDGTTQSANGNLNELMYPINKKAYNAKCKTFIMGKTEGVLTSNDGAAAQVGGYSTSAGKSFKSITLKFSPPKKLQYEDDTKVFPNNYAPWYAVLAYPVNQYNTTFTNPPTRPIPIQMVAEQQMWYKDM